ncbi:MAG: hypothetical protein WC467_03480 [Patescibacteria group bacterium]
MYSSKNGSEITIDPNDVTINAAGTNMAVATYPQENINKGDKRPVYVNFRELNLGPENQKKINEIFKEKQTDLLKTKKAKEKKLRRDRVKRLALSFAMGAN